MISRLLTNAVMAVGVGIRLLVPALTWKVGEIEDDIHRHFQDEGR